MQNEVLVYRRCLRLLQRFLAANGMLERALAHLSGAKDDSVAEGGGRMASKAVPVSDFLTAVRGGHGASAPHREWCDPHASLSQPLVLNVPGLERPKQHRARTAEALKIVHSPGLYAALAVSEGAPPGPCTPASP